MVKKSPRMAAYIILQNLERKRAHIETAFNASREFSGMGRRDRAFVTELVYGVTRWKRSLDTIIGAVSSRPVSRIDLGPLIMLRMGLYQAFGMSRTPVFAAVDETVNLCKMNAPTCRAAVFINAVLRNAIRKIGRGKGFPTSIPETVERLQPRSLHANRRLGELYSFPDWLAARWIRDFGVEKARLIMKESSRQAPVFLRVNTAKTAAEDFPALLEKEGVTAKPTDWSGELWRVTDGVVGPGSKIFTEGHAQPQDAASYLAASMIETGPAGVIADLCCGKGIKSGYFARCADGGGSVVSFDNSPAALSALRTNMARLGARGVRPVAADLTGPWPVKGKFSSIFLDAPCSGTGVFRRRPEGKWHKDEGLIGRMAAVQSKMLENAVAHLAPGGSLVYAVCSIEPEEGSGQIGRILAKTPGLERADIRAEFPGMAGLVDGAGDFFAYPGDSGMDGFFASKLVLKG